MESVRFPSRKLRSELSNLSRTVSPGSSFNFSGLVHGLFSKSDLFVTVTAVTNFREVSDDIPRDNRRACDIRMADNDPRANN